MFLELILFNFQKLLDETTSRVVCASPLIYHEGHGGAMLSSQSSTAVSNSSISGMMSGMVDEGVVIFITHQSALVVMFFLEAAPAPATDSFIPYVTFDCVLAFIVYLNLPSFIFL